jgi:predicted pyridoxine 5'-phosphate oxidase superfamily flavin-nucleotide-binding protein
MERRFHRGELAVQQRVGVRKQADKIGRSMHREVPPSAAAFLEQRRFVVLATTDAWARPWASIVTGPPGFASASDPLEVRVDAAPLPGDPLRENLARSRFVGLLAIDLATRRRMRVNGTLAPAAGAAIVLRVEQAYSNCPKYIQRRDVEGEPSPGAPRVRGRAGTLTEGQREWIRAADTFFVATVNPGEGADASHRGGLPGFVQVEGDRVTWPDYAGNMMYNTLGNIAAYPRAGVLVPDFASGAVLQLTGRAGILWDVGRRPGAERQVELLVEDVVEIEGVLPRADGVEYSPFNPARA